MKARGEFKTHREWFERQFGKRPTSISPLSLKRMVDDARAEARRLELLQSAAEMWDEQHRASTYAWNVFGGRLADEP